MFRQRRGFTLPEVMLALSVMAFTVGVFAVTFPAASQAISRSKHLDLASDSSQRQLDFYRDVGYNSLPSIAAGAASTTVSFTPSSDLPGAAGRVTFTRVDASFNPTTTETGRRKMEATVTWTGTGSDHGSYTLTSLILQ